MKTTRGLFVSTVFLLLVWTAGCTVSHVSSITSNYPPETEVEITCKEYDPKDKLTLVAEGIVEAEKVGWKPKVIGYKHQNFLGMLDSDIIICYERPK